jgi:hypothetical protein
MMDSTFDVKKKPVNMTFTFDLTRHAFSGLGKFWQPIMKTAFSLPHLIHKPMIHRRLYTQFFSESFHPR